MDDFGVPLPEEDQAVGRDSAGQPVTQRYLIYLLIVATGGWAMSAYDFNLQVMSLNDIAKGLHLSSTQVGLFGFFVDFVELVFSLSFGRFMDRQSRRLAWITALSGATVFPGLTFFVRNYWQLCIVRSLASGFAYTEQAISITLVNESLPIKRRGVYYSIVQAGWPIGVVMAAAIYLLTIHLGWHFLFVFGVAPFAAISIGRIGSGSRSGFGGSGRSARHTTPETKRKASSSVTSTIFPLNMREPTVSWNCSARISATRPSC